MLGMMTLMPSISFALDAANAKLLKLIWNYRRNYSFPVVGTEQNVYMRYNFEMDKRNVLLFLVPTMYVIADGEKKFVGESYCKLRFRDVGDYDLQRQVVCGTIPRQRTAMPPMLEFSTPDFYDETLYPNHLLSPFNKSNRRFYYYSIGAEIGGMCMIHFRPKTPNTQLISGQAVVDVNTGRLHSVQFHGEFDMISFKVSVIMNAHDLHTPLPERCHTEAQFKFMGNKVKASLSTVYNCQETLPDSVDEVKDRNLMAALRPIPLTSAEKEIYNQYDQEHAPKPEETVVDTTKQHRHNWVKEIGWDILGYNPIKSHKTTMGDVVLLQFDT